MDPTPGSANAHALAVMRWLKTKMVRMVGISGDADLCPVVGLYDGGRCEALFLVNSDDQLTMLRLMASVITLSDCDCVAVGMDGYHGGGPGTGIQTRSELLAAFAAGDPDVFEGLVVCSMQAADLSTEMTSCRYRLGLGRKVEYDPPESGAANAGAILGAMRAGVQCRPSRQGPPLQPEWIGKLLSVEHVKPPPSYELFGR